MSKQEGSLTWSPQLDTLLLVRHAHAVVAVGLPVRTSRAVQQVHIGGAVRRSPGAVLWEVARPSWLSAHSPGCFELWAPPGRKGEREAFPSGLGALGTEAFVQPGAGRAHGPASAALSLQDGSDRTGLPCSWHSSPRGHTRLQLSACSSVGCSKDSCTPEERGESRRSG